MGTLFFVFIIRGRVHRGAKESKERPKRPQTMSPLSTLFICCAASLVLCQAGNPTDPAGSCGTKPTPADCGNVDFGSCGNACCKIHFTTTLTPDLLATAITDKLTNGGADGGFVLQENAEGSLGFANFTSRKGVPKMLQYIGPTYHTTYGPAHYNDTINMVIYPDVLYEGNAVLEVFSVSQIPGAFGDAGQNYKNIMMVTEALGNDMMKNNTVFGCGSPSPPPPFK